MRKTMTAWLTSKTPHHHISLAPADADAHSSCARGDISPLRSPPPQQVGEVQVYRTSPATLGRGTIERSEDGGGVSLRPSLLTAASTLLAVLALPACTLAPQYDRPDLPVAQQWQIPTATQADTQLHWKALFLDPGLQRTIQRALDNNRDLRVAVLNIEAARARYGIQRADLFPALDATVSGTRSHGGSGAAGAGASGAGGDTTAYTADLGLSWELDLFGRVRSLTAAAKETFFASRENRDAVAIALIGSTADAWLALAADRDGLALSQQTFTTRQQAYDIAVNQAKIGVLSDIELNQQKTLLEQARGDVAAAQTQVDQDIAALTLLAGAAVPDADLPSGLKDGQVADSLPVGLPSQVLLNRPDVLAAEHSLKAANADIGAARAAFFPTISLTGSAGGASSDLGNLFSNGTWSYGVRLAQSIFAGGANVANLRGAKVSRDIAVAQYEGAIQSAFNDVNQALAVRARIDERLDAQRAATESALATLNLQQAAYRAGSQSYLDILDAQRTAYTAQQALIGLQFQKSDNLVALYRALGDSASLE